MNIYKPTCSRDPWDLATCGYHLVFWPENPEPHSGNSNVSKDSDKKVHDLHAVEVSGSGLVLSH